MRILGSLLGMKVPRTIGGRSWGGLYVTRSIFAKYSYSTQLMLNCWRQHCSSGKELELEKLNLANPMLSGGAKGNAADAQLDDLLEDSTGERAAAGWDCG